MSLSMRRRSGPAPRGWPRVDLKREPMHLPGAFKWTALMADVLRKHASRWTSKTGSRSDGLPEKARCRTGRSGITMRIGKMPTWALCTSSRSGASSRVSMSGFAYRSNRTIRTSFILSGPLQHLGTQGDVGRSAWPNFECLAHLRFHVAYYVHCAAHDRWLASVSAPAGAPRNALPPSKTSFRFRQYIGLAAG